ncbi:putative uncharacterized transposon-derived protein F52C9.6 [Nymphon striatum]|nr:putative uncharacterized transposon-derived protein F52C9.6 [Nymphon striatum]
MTKLNILWKDINLGITSQMHLLRTIIQATLLYSAEAWTIKTTMEKKINAFELIAYRRLPQIPYTAHVTNAKVLTEVEKQIGCFDRMITIVKKRKFNLFGHICRTEGVEHQAVLNAINAQNISPGYIRILDQIFRLGTSNIKLHSNTNKIRLDKGVRHGDLISPKIFTAFLQNVFRCFNWTSKGIPINGDRLPNLWFAGDVVLFSESPQELQLMVEELRTASNNVGLEINLSKTKVIFNRNVDIQPIMTGNVTLDLVDRYTYLGQLISIYRDWEPEVRRRVALGMTLNEIDILTSDVSEIEKDAFKDSLNSLTTIDIDGSKLTKIPFEALSNIKRLHELRLANSLIPSIARSEIDELPSSLTKLDLTQNKISQIDSNAFDKLVNLKSLLFDDNLLSSFIIPIPPKLNSLSFYDNNIKAIEDINWLMIPDHSKLYMDNNDITALPIKDILENMINKKIIIFLQENNIICDCGTKWTLEYPVGINYYIKYALCASGSGKRTSKYLNNLGKDDYSDFTDDIVLASDPSIVTYIGYNGGESTPDHIFCPRTHGCKYNVYANIKFDQFPISISVFPPSSTK